ncbi:DUF2177 family protein [Qipengyuania sp. XHP0211]|uniref:DUF2177 family protein n=1 Tax=Qipengyuania profundimaris TaxID=3067652 RepID=A0ABT9HPP4_9SPHN|nr:MULTISPECIES: DUF2177 family protein [unclassified Qipengyuania]MDG5751382.1 DUF2177 family protein [Qipengyuania sp. XHP0211]MDP4575128.1 DUF2177 family protein [Qipengyuania sp. G39]
MTWIVAFVAAAIAFGVLDALWLGWAGDNFYRPRLGDMLADSFRMAPALVFYVAYIAGIVWFAVRPGLAGGVGMAALNGALLGALCYATYDLTNQATLRQWSTTVTLADICWGAFATAVAASVATFAATKLV